MLQVIGTAFAKSKRRSTLIVDAMANAIKQATDRSTSPCKKVTLIVFSAKGTPTNYNHIKLICSSLSNNFPETMAWALVFPTNIFSRGIWHFVKHFLDPVVREKVVLRGGSKQPPGSLRALLSRTY